MASAEEQSAADVLDQCSDKILYGLLKDLLAGRAGVVQDLVSWAVPDVVYGSSKILESRYVGTVKSFTPASGYGFVTSPELIEALGKDLFLSGQQLELYPPGTFVSGSEISFIILMCKGKLQAYDVHPLQPNKGAGKGVDFQDAGWWGNAAGKGAAGGKTYARSKGKSDNQSWADAREPLRVPHASQRGPVHRGSSERFEGQVKSYNAKRRYGFFVCKDLVPMFGKDDIFVHGHQLTDFGDLQVGETMTFALGHDDKGQPMAVDLAYGGLAGYGSGGKGSPASTYRSLPWLTGQRFEAPVKSWNDSKKYGFVLCPELESTFGKADIFIHGSQTGQLGAEPRVGQLLSFTVVGDDQGKPMAVDIEMGGGGSGAKKGSKGKGKGGGGVPTYSPIRGLSGERYKAPVKSWNNEKKYGFLLCEELASTFGKADIFIHASQLGEIGDLKVGQVLSFTVVGDDQGKPMAVELELEDDSAAKRARLH